MKQTINNPSRPWNRISLLTVISLLILSLSWTDSPMELTPVSADSHGVFSPDWSANPPNGRTGAPGDGLCSDCHIQTGPPQDGSVAITGFPGTIIPNQVYTLTVTVANPNGLAVRGGFQMVVLNSGDTNAGSMANGSASSTVTISGGRTYHEHNPALFFGAGTEVIYSVDWTAPSGPNAELITAYAAGNVVNGNGSNTGDLVVTTNISGTIAGSALNVVVLTSDETCFGENDGIAAAEVSGGTPGYTYSWSNGATTATINDLSPGTYCVTVTDDDGNTAENCADVGGPSPVVGSLVETSDPSCAGSADGMVEVTASGGIPGYTYMWSNGDSGATINGLTAGTYTVTITDAAGCTDVLFAVVTDPAPITILLVDLVDPACFGESSGEITVATAGGTGIVTLEWSTGDIGPSIDGLPAGDYSVVATDENGCVEEAGFELFDPVELVLQLVQLIDVSCNGESDGSIAVNIPGDNGTYIWSNGATGELNDNLPAGTYSVTVTDGNECTAEAVYTISEPAAIVIDLSGETSVLCFGDTTGMIIANVTGGQAPYTYVWSNGDSTQAISSLAAGEYSVTVTDQSGCLATVTIEISEPGELMANVTTTDETSAGAEDGTAGSNPMGGTPPYSYIWATGATTQLITDLGPGTYSVTVTDSNGCTSVQSGIVNEFDCNLTAEIIIGNISCDGLNDGFAEVTFGGAQGPVTYLWSIGATTQSITDLGPGTYSVTVTDSAGCVASVAGEVSSPPAIMTNCTVLHESAAGANDGSIACKVSGGVAPYTLPGQMVTVDSFQMTGLAPGDYNIVITDANGCEFNQIITINMFGCPIIDNISILDVMCNGESSGSALVEFSGAQSPVSVIWSTGFTGNPVAMLAAGNYSVTISDSSGCMSSVNFVVAEPEAIALVVDTIIHESGAGENGAVQITVTGGTPPYMYDWILNNNTISTDQNPDGLTMGEYIVNVVDANGCAFQSDTIIVQGITAVKKVVSQINISIVPNPVSNFTILSWDKDVSINTVEIWSVQGAKVIGYKLSNNSIRQFTINTEYLTQGLYYVVAAGHAGKGVLKLVKI